MIDEWHLKPGDTIRRTELHDRYGGQRQGGISPSRQSPNVMIFTDPDTGHQHGYLDRWDEGVLHYTGEGQTGDQEMKAGNRQILDHATDDRALRVFRGSTGVVEYDGKYVLAADPYYHQRAPQTGESGVMRQVVMFRLVPDGEVATRRDRQLAGHRTLAPETDMAKTAVGMLANDGSTTTGQRFQQDKYVRRATELHAMQAATAHYEALGWTVHGVSANSPYDLEAVKVNAVKHVEVKGTQSAGQEILLTPNEVAHARAYGDVALYVLHSIQIEGSGTPSTVTGGVGLIHDPWVIDAGHLAPIGYAYGVPG